MPRNPEVYPAAFCPRCNFLNIGSSILRIAQTVFCLLPSAFFLLLFFITHHSSLITVYAQGATATLSGTVTDPNGAVIPGVNIAVISIAQGFQRKTTTSEDGTFVVPGLSPGRYIVKAEREGFSTSEFRDVVLNVNDQVSIPVRLSIGNISQTVLIEGGSLIDESPAVGTVVDRTQVENMPLNGRSFQSLITLAPGVVLTKSSGANLGQFSVNGQRSNANYFTIDGVGANIGIGTTSSLGQTAAGSVPGLSALGSTSSLVSVDALQEFKILTSTYAPEFGRTPGGQISIVTRSGSNDFHGALFEYFRNDKLDAADWFVNATRVPKPPLRHNNFGGVIGGPLFLPRFGEGGDRLAYNGRNRTFFFFSYEGLRLRQPLVATVDVPSLALRQSAVTQIQPYLNAFPVPNGPAAANGLAQFSASYSNPSTLDSTSLRIDHTFNQKVSLFGRYNNAPSETVSRGTGAATTLSNLFANEQDVQTFTVGTTIAFSPRVVNELRANYSKTFGRGSQSLDNFGGAVAPPDRSLFPSFASPERSRAIFSLSFGTQRPGFSVGRIADNVQEQFNLVNSLSLVTPRHHWKVGVDYRRLSPEFGPQDYLQNGIFSNADQVRLGRAIFVTISSQQPTFPLFTNLSAFLQDTWNLTRRLTFTYGLRWEFNPPPTEANGNLPFTVTGLDNPSTLTLAPRGTPLYETTYGNFAPRVGFAYRLRGDQRQGTVIRGGVGVFYDIGNGQLGNSFTAFPYVSASKQLDNALFPISDEAAAPNPFTTAPPIRLEVTDPELVLPRTYQWNLSVEQSLSNNQTLTVSYLGSVGRQLIRRTRLLNVPASFEQLFVIRNDASSDYHSMQVQFQRRLSRGFQALASYAWSHSIDDASDEIIGSDLGRGPSDFDLRHNLAVSLTYNIAPPTRNKIIRAIAGNWSIDSIIHSQSATPINLVARVVQNVNGVSTSARPNLTLGIPVYINDPNAPGGKRLNDAVDPSRPGCKGPFCPAPIGQQGTLGRNVLRSFPVNQVDFALRRRFTISEKLKLQFKGEAFNIFNHPNFGDPNNSLTSPTFGRATTMYGRGLGAGGISGGFNPLYQLGGARSIQLSMRVEF